MRTNKEGLKSVAYIDLLIAKIAELEARLEKAGIIMGVPDTTTFTLQNVVDEVRPNNR